VIEIVDCRDADRTDVYAVGGWGWVHYREARDAGVWQERGYKLSLFEDGREIAYTEALCDWSDWEERAQEDLDAIELWLRVLRVLRGGPQAAGVEALAARIDAVRHAAEELAEVDEWGTDLTELLGEQADMLADRATKAETDAARRQDGRIHYGSLAQLVAKRLESDIRRSQLVALAAAPDFQDHPIPKRWEFPRPNFFSGIAEDAKRVAPYVMRNLLAGWKANQDMRDGLLTASDASGVTKTEMHALTGLARTTIDRSIATA
jgi:plasmid stabilization system protein ParE